MRLALILCGLLTATALATAERPVAPAPAPAPPALTPEQKAQKQAERDGLLTQRQEAEKRGQWVEAERLAQRVLSLELAIHGPRHAQVAAAYDTLAGLQERADNLAAARASRQKALDTWRALHGPNDGRARAAQWALRTVELQQQMGPDQRARHREADRLARQQAALYRARRYAEALPLAVRAVTAWQETVGEDHPLYAQSVANVGWIQLALGDLDAAEARFRVATRTYRQTLGENHSAYADMLNAQHLIAARRNQFDEAERLGRQALDIRLRVWGERSLPYAQSLNNLGHLYTRKKDYQKAEPLLRQALFLKRQLAGDESEDYLLTANNLASVLFARGRFSECATYLRDILDVQEKLYGTDDKRYQTSLNNLCLVRGRLVAAARAKLEKRQERRDLAVLRLAEELEDFARAQTRRWDLKTARQAWNDLLDLRSELPEKSRWRLVTAEVELKHLDRVAALDADGRQSLRDANRALRVAEARTREEKFREALRAARRAGDLLRAAVGEQDPHTLAALDRLADVWLARGDDDRAAPLLEEALRLRVQLYGEVHPSHAEGLERLARLHRNLGQPDRAQELDKLAHDVRIKTESIQPSAEPEFRLTRDQAIPGDYPGSLQKLALQYMQAGDFARAAPLLQQVRDLRRKDPGPEHPLYADSLSDLGVLHALLGDFARAEPLHVESLRIRKQALGEAGLAYAVGLHNLGTLYERMGAFAKAEPLLLRNVQVTEQAAGEAHEEYARALASLAFLYGRMENYPQAEQHYRRALRVFTAANGAEHPSTLRTLGNLGYLYLCKGDHEQAEPLLQRSYDLRVKVQGAEHPDTVDALADLAALHLARGEHDRAAVALRRSLEVTRKHLDVAATVQSERQQLVLAGKMRQRLDLLLTLADRSRLDLAEVYQEVLHWKGAAFLRRQRAQGQADPVLANLRKQSVQVSKQLAAQAFMEPPTDKQYAFWKRRLDELSARQEQLERSLSQRAGELARQTFAEPVTPRAVAAALPADAVLVDFLTYRHVPKAGAAAEPRVVAFVQRPGAAVVRVRLGPLQPIAEAVERWRKQLRGAAGGEAGAELRRLLWEPLEEQVQGARLVLVSPDDVLARVPFAALPGKAAGSFLLEERAVAVVPVVRVLPKMLDKAPTPAEADPSLLLVGNVNYGYAWQALRPDFDGVTRTAARDADGSLTFPELPGTWGEVLAVRDSFEKRHPDGRVRILRSADATEAQLRRLAPGHRWLHFATHGFFGDHQARKADDRPAQVLVSRQDVTGFHPGLLSGLALAGANQKPKPNADDGIFTALEVADLDLRGVELVTLSACETGLGELANGEGVLGLQRAFQAAGVRSVIASLWSVPDEPTRVLMERFYQNLWDKRMGRLDALIEAQRWMLREGRTHDSVQRGIRRLDAAPAAGDDGRLPPYYWAAFVLSGDWR